MLASDVLQEEDENPTSNFNKGIIISLPFPQTLPSHHESLPYNARCRRIRRPSLYQQQQMSQLLLLHIIACETNDIGVYFSAVGRKMLEVVD